MKRRYHLLIVPLVFLLSASLAWLTGTSKEKHSAALAELERKVLLAPDPPAEIYNAKGMDAALLSDEQTSCFPEGGMSAVQYSSRWATKAPEEMFAWLLRENGGDPFSAYILFNSWAKTDMTAALAAVFKIPNPDLRKQALLSSLEILCKSDPTRAREMMIQNLSLFTPDGQYLSFASYENGKTTCDMLLSLPASEERTHLLAKLLTDMANGLPNEMSKIAISVWQQFPKEFRQDLVAAGFSSSKDNTASFDGLEELMREQAEKTGNQLAVERFLEAHGPAWAGRDLAEALAWTQAHVKGKNRVELSVKLFEYVANQDFDSARTPRLNG